MSHSNCMSTVKDYNNIWKELAGDYVNYGRLPPDTDLDQIENLIGANENMVEHIIRVLNITSDSYVLDLGCGNGIYTVEIAKKTGCKFLGTDINSSYLERAGELVAQYGVQEQGDFQISSWEEMSPRVREHQYTHILSLGSLVYGYKDMDKVLEDMASCCLPNTIVFLWDFTRTVEWSDCVGWQKHVSLPHPMFNREEYLKKIEMSPLELINEEDMTPYIIPQHRFLIRECMKRDPDMVKYTNVHAANDFLNGNIKYNEFTLKIKQ